MKTILVVEDSDADFELMRIALSEHRGRVHLERVHNGEEALRYLHQQESWGGARRPDIILLDLNLPRVAGRDVIAKIKRDPSLMRIPVVVLTTSALDVDVAGTYEVGANCFVTKPPDLDRFLAMMRAVAQFWLSTATLPPT